MARTPKIDLESHFFTPEYMALLESRTRPPRFEVTDENVASGWSRRCPTSC